MISGATTSLASGTLDGSNNPNPAGTILVSAAPPVGGSAAPPASHSYQWVGIVIIVLLAILVFRKGA